MRIIEAAVNEFIIRWVACYRPVPLCPTLSRPLHSLIPGSLSRSHAPKVTTSRGKTRDLLPPLAGGSQGAIVPSPSTMQALMAARRATNEAITTR